MDQVPEVKLQSELSVPSEALIKAQQHAVAGQLALELMHDLRNPLEALGHLTYLALQCADDPAKVRSYLNMAQEQMAIIAELASHPLDFARNSGPPKLADLVLIAESALRIHQRTIESKKIHLVRDLAEKVEGSIYSAEILQVVSNLILNALDALPESGSLHLRLRKRGKSILILVADNGHGIPREHSEIIFQPFFTTKETRGTGLGLALSKRIVGHHGGKIQMRSCVTPGRNGTVFRISLPA
ncbi:MAG TPA: HAMP domain-containing sensor histidine kinase [Acidobacteriaceae bacterium]|nr:HAMP domain-containing sensor histidine kinase [Acidobacteriaceae bacterium]